MSNGLASEIVSGSRRRSISGSRGFRRHRLTARLVGRADEGARLTTIFNVDGPQSFLLTGIAGVGKSRLLTEVCAAADDGWHIEQLSGSAGLRDVAFGVVSRLIVPGRNPGSYADLLASVRAELVKRAKGQQLMVAVDDAHLLDEQSAALIHQLVLHGDARAIVVVREPDPASPSLTSLWKDGHAERIRLEPLSKADTEVLVASLLEGPVDPTLTHRVWDLTRGHPLYAVLLLQSSIDQGAVVLTETWHQVRELDPGQILDLVRRMLEDLPTTVRNALRLLAVADPITVAHLNRLVSRAAINELIQRGLATQLAGAGAAVLACAHPLLSEVVTAEMAPEEIGKVRAELAVPVLDQPNADPSMLIRVALWMSESAQGLDSELTLAAAAEAFRRADFRLAQRFAAEVVAEEASVEASLILARALTYQGRPTDGLEVLDSLGPVDDDELVDLTLARGHTLAFGLGRPHDAAEALRTASLSLPDRLRWPLDAERAIYTAFAGNFGATFDAATAAIENPDTPEPALAIAHVNLSLALAMTAQVDRFYPIVERGKDLASGRKGENPLALDQLGLAEASALVTAGRIEDARALCMSRIEGESSTAQMWHAWLGITLGLQGRVTEATETLGRTLQTFDSADPFRLRPQAVGLDVMHRAQLGPCDPEETRRIDEAREAARGETRLAVWIERGAAWLAALEDPSAAAAHALANGRQAIERDHLAWGAWALHDAVRWNEPAMVSSDLSHVAEASSGAALLEVMADHAHALVAGDAGRLGTVVESFNLAGATLLAAEAAAQRLRLLEASGGAGAVQGRAAFVATVLARRCVGAVTPALAGVCPRISERVIQILLDALAGVTSRQIAQRRFISVRTVDNHLGQAYRHLEIAGRRDLIALFGKYVRSAPS